MPQHFDEVRWKDLAKRRFDKAVKRNKFNAICRYNSDLKSITNISSIMEWCDKRGLEVRFDSPTSAYWPSLNLVHIHKAQLHVVVYLLLHEIGHYLVDVLGSTRSRTSKGYIAGKDDKTQAYKVDTIDEEYDAWHRGWNLAKRLELDIDEDGYSRYKTQSIMTYFRWAAS